MSTPEAVKATVIAELPQRLYRLLTEDGCQIIAGPSPQAQRNGGIYQRGERVWVQQASLDPGRGVILGRLLHEGQTARERQGGPEFGSEQNR